MYCNQDSTKQNISTAAIRKSVIRRLSEKYYLHIFLNKLKSGNKIQTKVLLLATYKANLNLFSKQFI